MSSEILTISQINEYLRTKLDNDPLLTNICVRGEISNYKIYPSGHHYFTLKDDNSALKCVMFRSSSIGLRFRPENGMKVIAVGRISVYPRDGAYQLYCNSLTADGVGDLHIAFEQLKKKLMGIGLFDPAHKREIPKFPKTVGIITSSAGAAVHDMLRILNARFPLAKVILLPVRVQGSEAPAEIVNAIAYANKYQLADVLIVGRGGGSIEDLWAFNNEGVAYAIYNSQIPVISAVGHEPDVTISDYVADLRAATPSNAAELCVPDQMALRQYMDKISSQLAVAVQRRIKAARQQLKIYSASSVLKSPDQYVLQRKNTLDSYNKRLEASYTNYIHLKKMKYISYASKLDALSPLKVLSRGFSLTQTHDGAVVSSIHHVHPGDEIRIAVKDGHIKGTVADITEDAYE